MAENKDFTLTVHAGARQDQILMGSDGKGLVLQTKDGGESWREMAGGGYVAMRFEAAHPIDLERAIDAVARHCGRPAAEVANARKASLASARHRLQELASSAVVDEERLCQVLGLALGLPPHPAGGVDTQQLSSLDLANQLAARYGYLQRRKIEIELAPYLEGMPTKLGRFRPRPDELSDLVDEVEIKRNPLANFVRVEKETTFFRAFFEDGRYLMIPGLMVADIRLMPEEPSQTAWPSSENLDEAKPAG